MGMFEAPFEVPGLEQSGKNSVLADRSYRLSVGVTSMWWE